MSTEISGSLIVGCHGSELPVQPREYENKQEWLEAYCIEALPSCYDANILDSYVGFELVNAMPISALPSKLEYITKLGDKFERITGVPASLIGCQNVW